MRLEQQQTKDESLVLAPSSAAACNPTSASLAPHFHLMDLDEDRRWAELPNPALKVQLISSTATWCHCFAAREDQGCLLLP